MTYSEMKSLSRAEISYHLLISKCLYFNEHISRITLLRVPTAKCLCSTIAVYLIDSFNLPHTEIFRLRNEEYILFLSAVSKDFPDIEFTDLTEESYKLTTYNIRGDSSE